MAWRAGYWLMSAVVFAAVLLFMVVIGESLVALFIGHNVVSTGISVFGGVFLGWVAMTRTLRAFREAWL